MLRNERWLLHIHSNDVDALHAALAAQGIQPLVNRAAHVRSGGTDLWIAGVDDLTQGKPDMAAALADVPEGALTILLAHNPDAWVDPGVACVDLVLAGHTHGGQLRLPGHRRALFPGQPPPAATAGGLVRAGRQPHVRQPRAGAELSFPPRRATAGGAHPVGASGGGGMRIAGDGFVLRTVGEAEMGALLAVYRQCEDFLALGPAPHASEEMIRGDLAASVAEGGVFCGIFVGATDIGATDDGAGEMLGVVDFAVHGHGGDRAEAHLALLMLARPHRGRGLGAQVVRAVEAEIWRDAQVKAIAAEVQVNNPAAIRFWGRQGYQVVGGPERVPDGTTVYHLRKQRESEDL